MQNLMAFLRSSLKVMDIKTDRPAPYKTVIIEYKVGFSVHQHTAYMVWDESAGYLWMMCGKNTFVRDENVIRWDYINDKLTCYLYED